MLNTVGDIMSTVGDTQYRGEHYDARGDIMMHMGGYHEYRGGKTFVI